MADRRVAIPQIPRQTPAKTQYCFPDLTNFSARLQFFCSVVFACWAGETCRETCRETDRHKPAAGANPTLTTDYGPASIWTACAPTDNCVYIRVVVKQTYCCIALIATQL